MNSTYNQLCTNLERLKLGQMKICGRSVKTEQL